MSITSSPKHIHTSTGIVYPFVTFPFFIRDIATFNSVLLIACVKPSFGIPSSKTALWFSSFSSLSKYPIPLPIIISTSLKTTPCCFIWVKSLVPLSRAFAFPNISLPPSLGSNSSYHAFIAMPAPWLLLLLSLPPCSPACIYLCPLASVMIPYLMCLCLSSTYHILHLIVPPPLLLISWGSRPVVVPNTSCPTLNIVVTSRSYIYLFGLYGPMHTATNDCTGTRLIPCRWNSTWWRHTT